MECPQHQTKTTVFKYTVTICVISAAGKATYNSLHTIADSPDKALKSAVNECEALKEEGATFEAVSVTEGYTTNLLGNKGFGAGITAPPEVWVVIGGDSDKGTPQTDVYHNAASDAITVMGAIAMETIIYEYDNFRQLIANDPDVAENLVKFSNLLDTDYPGCILQQALEASIHNPLEWHPALYEMYSSLTQEHGYYEEQEDDVDQGDDYYPEGFNSYSEFQQSIKDAEREREAWQDDVQAELEAENITHGVFAS